MLTEALQKGFYHSPGWNRDYPRLQIVTVEDLLNCRSIEMPQTSITFKQAEKVSAKNDDQSILAFD